MLVGNWLIVDAIKDIWAGERDPDVLTQGIDRNSALIVRRILAMLDAPSSPTSSPADGEGVREAASSAGQGLTLPQLLDLVERAARGDRELGGQLFEALRGMASDPGQPPEVRALGKVLVSILVGDRDPNLDALPPQMASAVRGMLARLRE
ncbi:MAG: hypothetical protein H6649_15400 [Caldilineae bacterium]|nr:hypothetical protein [Caldilineae bacterium]